MKVVTFYDPATGELGRPFAGPDEQLQHNLPAGWACVPGWHDANSCRVRLVLDDFGDQLPVVEPRTAEAAPDDDDVLAARARVARNAALRDCDWVTLRAMRTGQPIPSEWADYMQALADVPQQPGFPRHIDWPTPPTP